MLNSFDKNIESIHNLETDFVKILYYDLPENLSGNYYSHGNIRLCTILEGQKNIKLKNKNFLYNKSDFLLLPPNSKVHMNIPVNTKALVFEINDTLINTVLNKINLDESIKHSINSTIDTSFFLGKNSTPIKDDLHDLFLLFNDSNKNKNFLIDIYSQKLVYDLINSKASKHIMNSLKNDPIFLSIRFIDENLEKKINLENLAREFGMSLSQFSSLFKKRMNINPSEYILNKKLELATDLLKTNTVTEVAFTLGYENISYFIKLFKLRYGLTPKQFKLRYF